MDKQDFLKQFRATTKHSQREKLFRDHPEYETITIKEYFSPLRTPSLEPEEIDALAQVLLKLVDDEAKLRGGLLKKVKDEGTKRKLNLYWTKVIEVLGNKVEPIRLSTTLIAYKKAA